MLPPHLFRSVAVGVCAILVATGVAFAPIAAQAEEGLGAGAPTSTAPATESPSPAPTDTQAPIATEEPTSTSTPGPDDTAIPSPAEDSPAAELPTPEETATPEPAAASSLFMEASASFNPGLIISDYNFFNSWAMTESEIQNFLNAKIGACQNSYCLNVYRMDTPTKSFSFGQCATYQGAANESAARIIYKVQRACGISAKAILVTLQKEQGLVTSSAPSLGVLRKAMGYGCPDTSECDANFYGFFNQVYTAGRQLTWYSNPEGSFTTIKIGQVNAVRYHPNAACGSGNVTVQNRATAALYYYTPYQPNGAALAAGYGASADACASYGNRNFFNYYRDWFGNPTAASSPAVNRVAGEDRYSTAVSISRSVFPSNAAAVYVTTGESFPDALSAAPAAAKAGGPLLLVASNVLPGTTRDEINRLKPQKIVVVGGPQAISDSVYAQLAALQPNIERVSGIDRYETSRMLAAKVFTGATAAYVATGLNFPDALSASAAAGTKGMPVVLVDASVNISDATRALFGAMGTKSVKIVGGVNAVSSTQEADLRAAGLSPVRLAGSDRYTTSVAINNDAFPTASTVYLATGTSYPDALAGAAAAGKVGSPLYVTFSSCMPAVIRTEITNRNAQTLNLLGGPNALNDNIAAMATC